jgi:hypothetical protein
MITSTTPLNVILSSLDDYILEMQPDWEMVVDYVCSQVNSLTIAEWAQVEKVYDQIIQGE